MPRKPELFQRQVKDAELNGRRVAGLNRRPVADPTEAYSQAPAPDRCCGSQFTCGCRTGCVVCNRCGSFSQVTFIWNSKRQMRRHDVQEFSWRDDFRPFPYLQRCGSVGNANSHSGISYARIFLLAIRVALMVSSIFLGVSLSVPFAFDSPPMILSTSGSGAARRI